MFRSGVTIRSGGCSSPPAPYLPDATTIPATPARSPHRRDDPLPRASRSVPASVLAAALVLVACGEPPRTDEGAERPGVVVSVPPQAWFVRRLAGPEVEVTVLVPPGASPLLYEPTLRQIRALERARILLLVGHPRFPFERAWRGELLRERSGLRVVRAAAGCATVPDDPHVWLSPACARSMTGQLADALAAELPDRAAAVREREAELLARIEGLDRELSARLAPYRGESFLVFHPALGYFARAYGLEQMAVERRSGEPNASELSSVLARARERGIHTVFVQPQFSHDAARLVARRLTGGRLAVVDPLAADWPRTMLELAEKLVASFRRGPDGG